MTRQMNPRWVAGAVFLVTGLIWSGGHVAWLVLFGAWVLLGILADRG